MHMPKGHDAHPIQLGYAQTFLALVDADFLHDH